MHSRRFKSKRVVLLLPILKADDKKGEEQGEDAVAHSLLIAIYYIIRDRVPFRDLGEDYYDRFNAESKVNLYIRKLEKLGMAVSITPSMAQA